MKEFDLAEYGLKGVCRLTEMMREPVEMRIGRCSSSPHPRHLMLQPNQ